MNNQNTCIAINCPDSYREHSVSGGVFPYIAEKIINTGGYVAGAVYNENYTEVYHSVSNQWDQVQLMRSSKYVHSHANKSFKQIAELLTQGKTVLFTGCACQCAALQTYLQGKASTDNLITIDVICYGTPEPRVYKSYINYLIEQYGPISTVDFRKKSEFGWKCGLYIKFVNDNVLSSEPMSPYLKGFLDGYIMCSFCHHCKFKSAKYSDMTIGDFWGIEHTNPSLADGKGTSLIEINTPKGQKLFDKIFVNVSSKSLHPIAPAIEDNLALRYPIPEHPLRKKFFELFNARTSDLDFWKNISIEKVFK